MTRHWSTARAVSAPPAAPGHEARPCPQRLVVLAATGLALAVRLYLLTRPGYLSGITEYDDGVYLGGAVSLLSGVLPYHGFAFVQPPGVLLLMAPVALLAKACGTSTAMVAARLLTVLASGACVLLVGVLVRHRGTLVTLVACGTLAVYPDDIITARTLLLEPWMNVLVLSGACLAFRRGRLASPQRLLWSGALFGLAGAVKYWAAVPALVLLALCLVTRPEGGLAGTQDTGSGWRSVWRDGGRAGRAARFAGGAGAGFAVPVLPFAAPWPGLFLHSTLLDQVARAGSAVPESLRLAHLTGLADLLDDAGRLTASGSETTLFARADVTATATWADGWLPVAIAVAVAALLLLGFAVGRHGERPGAAARAPALASDAAGPDAGGTPGPLEWYALVTLGCALAAVLGYSAFFYHYADFAAPWLAIAAGHAAGALSGRFLPRRTARTHRLPALETGTAGLALRRQGTARRQMTWAAVAFTVIAGFQAWELSGSRACDVHAGAALIPRGACVVSDEVSLTIVANKFTAGMSGCPDVLDSLAVTLVAGNGVSVQGGAQALPHVVADWKSVFCGAQYVWLSGTSDRRIPWTPKLKAWFARAFRPLHPPAGEFGEGRVYIRRG